MRIRQVSVSPEMVEVKARWRLLLVVAVGCAGLAACGQPSSSSGVDQTTFCRDDVVLPARTND